MNPSKALLKLCKKFLDQHQGEERTGLLEQIVYDIKCRTEMVRTCPATAKELTRMTNTLLTSTGKLDTVKGGIRRSANPTCQERPWRTWPHVALRFT